MRHREGSDTVYFEYLYRFDSQGNSSVEMSKHSAQIK